MKNNLTVLIFVCLFLFVITPTVTTAQQTFQTTSETVIGLLQYLPADYNSNSNKYPLVIFLHGVGERGANSTDPKVLESTIYSVDNLGPPKSALDGYNFPFILISPQLKNNYNSWPNWYILEVLNWAKSRFRVDEKRIHITGLSMGGAGAWTAIQDYPKLFASAAPVCGAFNSISKAPAIAAENIPVWGFHGDADPTVALSKSVAMVNAINAVSPAPNPKAKLTIYPGVKHDAWNYAYRTDHSYHNPNVYEWMMSYVNTKNGTNMIPTANAGADKSYGTASTIYLTGSGTDSDGSISSYKWSKIAGPSVTFTSATTASTSATITAPGTFMFKLTVTDNNGDTDSDYVKVVVSATGNAVTEPNKPPTVSAGSDIILTLPASTAIINGTATDSDGSIASYAWTKLSGPDGNFSNANTRTLTAWRLVAGTYVFRLTVKDDKGASAYDDVQVIVKGAATQQSPIVNAGPDVNMSLPWTTATFNGSATDPDGRIVSYVWTKSSGPAANLSNANTPTLTAWGLVAGTYVFRLTAKDNDGRTAYDEVRLVVSAANGAPTVNAGPDVSLKLPASTAILNGSASGGTIKSYTWTKLSGPAGNLSNANTATLTAWRLVAGSYVFRLTVKDEKGSTAYDDVMVKVNN